LTASCSRNSPWWGDFRLDTGQSGRWIVGPATVWLHRELREWRMGYARTRNPLENAAQVDVPAPASEAGLFGPDHGDPQVVRYSFAETTAAIRVYPALADRPIIMRPETPLWVPEGERVTIYMSSPLWLGFEANTPGRLLQEIPSHRPSDTWFGSSTREGELCYAVTTTGRLRLEDIPLMLHRAITPVIVVNQAKGSLYVEKVQLPVTHLSLYQSASGFLWTQPVRLERIASDGATNIRFQEGPPDEAGQAQLIREPREKLRTTVITRTFDIFHSIF
jgi:hypothetical protein